MAQEIYRENSVKRMSSPEQLNEYLKVTKPAVWIVLFSVAVLVIGAVVWGSLTYIDSYSTGTATVTDGAMTITFDDNALAKNVTEGMAVETEGIRETITEITYDSSGKIIAHAKTQLKNGTYEARVGYKRTQILSILFGK